MEVTMHRFVLAEFNTHRVFSRNSASSRAIPIEKQITRVLDDIAFPVVWPMEKAGMQGGDPLHEEDEARARLIWGDARNSAVAHARLLSNMGVHKSVVNRLLEPFMWHTVIVTSTEWRNFFGLRCHEMAQPEIRAAADLMKAAYEESTPRRLKWNEWHLPYVTDSEESVCSPAQMRMISVARCAWVSTMNHDGDHSLAACERMYERLTTAVPMHASPLEHQARPLLAEEDSLGNYRGWLQWRHIVEATL